jgi:hypothetical protein
LPCLALPCLALPCLALPCLALPCLALPCLALPCLAFLIAPCICFSLTHCVCVVWIFLLNRSANQARSTWESKKLTWPTTEVVDRAGWGISTNAQDDRVYFDNEKDQSEGGGMTVTLNAMEVKTYLVTMA